MKPAGIFRRDHDHFQYRTRSGHERIFLGFTTRQFPYPVKKSADLAKITKYSRSVLKPKSRAHFLSDKKMRVCYPLQIHSAKTVHVTSSKIQATSRKSWFCFPGSDGLMTSLSKVSLLVVSADCLPIFFVVPSKPAAVALVHAGWRGTAGRIAQRMVRRLEKVANTPKRRYLAFFGPAIRSCCYRVGPEFQKRFPGAIQSKNNAHYLDLIRENTSQLIDVGLRKTNIFDSGMCTSCQSRLFYSYRREKQEARRLISWISKDNSL